MDELSADDLRGTAFAANLRRAFATPAEGALPLRFLMLLDRLSEVKLPVAGSRPAASRRLEA
jgi:hypothetical protein